MYEKNYSSIKNSVTFLFIWFEWWTVYDEQFQEWIINEQFQERITNEQFQEWKKLETL